MKFIAILVTFVVAFVGSSCAASTEQQHGRKLGKKSAKSAKVENPMNYFSLLSAAQRDFTTCAAGIGAAANGNAIVTYDSTLTTAELCVRITYTGLTGTPSAININGPAQVGVHTGPVIFTATSATTGFPASGSSGSFVGCFDVTTSLQKEYLDSGLLYFNIPTVTSAGSTFCASGELRGQIFVTP
jgi:hypothetical protein